MGSESKTIIKWVIGSILVILLIVTLVGGVIFIPAGEVGVITQFGATTGRIVEQGMSFKLPLFQGVAKMSIKTQIYQADGLTAASKDLQDVTTNIAINYKIDPTKAAEIFRTIGVEYMDIIAHPAIQEIVKEITAKYNAEDCITKRAEVKDAISFSLVNRLAERGIIVESVNITNFEFSPEFTAAIEAKVVAQQKIETAQNDLERMKVEAEQAVVVAQGKAQANDILAASLSDEVLAAMLYGIISNNDKIIIIPDTGFDGGVVVNP
jgi:regulator of protease activity HflC (stomatin/prohibitin superfamily)